MVVNSIKKSKLTPTILTSLHHPFPYAYTPSRRYNKSGFDVPVVQPNEMTLFNGGEYILFVDMQDDEDTYMKRLNSLPLHQPAKLIFSTRNTIIHGNIWSRLGGFSQVKSFSILNDYPSSFPDTHLGILLHRLQELTLHVKKFPLNFQLLNLLPTTIQELHLRNNARGPLLILSTNFKLPQL
jgi:hypothetical protein